MVSQFNMIERFNKLIKKEISKTKNAMQGLIRIKINNLEEVDMINMLYEAGRAGVTIELIVRSICCLVPARINISDNIVAKRIVDRYLEHSRIFIFGRNEDCEVIIGSADWMNRNLHRRIEVCVPVEDARCKQELIDYFELQWEDNVKSVNITDSLEQQLQTINGNVVAAQKAIYNYIKQKA